MALRNAPDHARQLEKRIQTPDAADGCLMPIYQKPNTSNDSKKKQKKKN